MTYSRLEYSVRGRICRLTLSRPDKRNALDDLLVSELAHAMAAASKDPDVRVVILTGSGPAFCAGADLEYLQKLSRYDFSQNLEDSKNLMKLFHQLYTLRKPVIAEVNGAALAGGCGLATACDLIVASDNATFGYPEVSLGFVPAVVLTFLLRRVGEGKARELVMTGKTLRASEALEVGLVNEVVPASRLSARVEELAETLCNNCSAASLGHLKEMFSRLDGLNFPDLLEYAANINAAARMSEDFKKGMASFLKKEKVQW